MLLKKSLTVIIKSILLCSTVIYPFIVLFILQKHLPIRYLGFLLLLLVCVTFVKHKKFFLLITGTLLAILTLWTDYDIFAKLYPVLMNGAFCYLFTSSLIAHQPLITTFVQKIHNKHLITHTERQYTEKLTIIWAIFLFINTIISLITVFLSYKIWAIYNGFISYILMGILFIVEWLFRKRFLHV